MKVGEAIKILEEDGWVLHSQKGSHRHFKHASKRAGSPHPTRMSSDLNPKTEASIFKQTQIDKPQKGTIMQYAVVIREAIELHIEGMREDGEEIPRPTVVFVEVAA